jgi:ubiquinone/menaquinone biosynthesis C-methylase UbiE
MSKSFHSTHAETYERMGSNATLNIAKVFVPELPPIKDSSYILDNACGTGIVTQLIKAKHPKAIIKCVDLAPGMIDIIKWKVDELKWENVETDVLDVRNLKTLEGNSFTHVLTNFGFSPTPDDPAGPRKAAGEMWRVCKPGGVVVVTTWSGIFPLCPPALLSVDDFVNRAQLRHSSRKCSSRRPSQRETILVAHAR